MSAGRSEESSPVANPNIYRREFWLVFVASFALYSVTNLFVLFPLFVVGLGGTASVIGAVVGTGSMFALIARPYVGPAIDRSGARSTTLYFLMLDVAAIALYIPIRTLRWPIYAVRAIHGAVEGTARVAQFAMVYELLPEGREGEAMAIFSLSGMIPGALAPAAGEVLISRGGFLAFFAGAIVLIVVGAVFIAMLPAGNESHAKQSDAGDAPGYAALLRDRGLFPLWIVTLLFSLALSSRLSFVAPFAAEKHGARVGLYFFLYSAIGTLARLSGRRAMDRFGLGRVLVPALLVLGVGVMMIAGTGEMHLLQWAALVGGLGHGFVYPALSAMVIARTHDDAMGRSSSVYTSLYDAGTMAGPYALGVIGELFGYGPLFIVAGVLALAAAAYFRTVEPHPA
jgi:MFS family permease